MSGGSLDGREVWRRMSTCICIAESLRFSPETITTLFVNWLYPNKKVLKQQNKTNPLK